MPGHLKLHIKRSIGVLFIGFSLFGCVHEQENSLRPNVLFIVADDLGYGDLQCYGNPYIETPNINRLASEGVRLTRYYSPSPLCAPARAALLTGLYNHRTGAIDVSSNRGIDRIALSIKTSGDRMKDIGYATAMIGKWHNGLYDERYLPYNRGFDYFYGFLNGIQDYYDWNLNRNGVNVTSDGTYLTDELTSDAITYVEKYKDDPFFLMVNYHAPHSPFQAPEKIIEKYIKKSNGDYGQTVATIYAMIEVMDTGIGRILDKLDALGIAENTIVIFTSDNGPILTGKSFDNTSVRFNGQWSGMKGWTWEGGIRVPAIVRWTGKIPSAKVLDEPVSGIDWLPTFFDLIGDRQEPAVFDGISIAPLLQGNSIEERPLFFQKNRYHPVAHSDAAVELGDWKLYWPAIPETMKKESKDNVSVREGTTVPHWLMPIDTIIPKWEGVTPLEPRLFNLALDPSENYDISKQNPEIVKEMINRYDGWFEDVMEDYEKSWSEIKALERAIPVK